jgi:acetyltransferase-like isoleucine patch superfamily enzyme
VSGRQVAKSYFPYREVQKDPACEWELAAYLKERYSKEELMGLYDRYKRSVDPFDALLRRAILKSLCKSMGDDVQISNDVEIRNPEVIEFGTHVFISPYVNLQAWWKGSLKIGDNVWIGSNVFIDGKDVTLEGEIGIGPGVTFIGSQHTGIPVDLAVFRTDHVVEPIVVEKGVDIGANSVILSGVTIGENSVIGAGSVVNRDVPRDSVAVGSPARVIKKRGEGAKEASDESSS